MEPYFQTTPFTTAASSLLNLLSLKGNTPTKEEEFTIWHNTANLPTRGSSAYGLALYAHSQGLTPHLVVSEIDYDFPDYRFYRYTKEDIQHASYSDQKYLQKCLQKGISLREQEITLQNVQDLAQDYYLILRLNTKPIRGGKRNTSNYILVLGFNEGYFHILDPAYKAISIPFDLMKEAFESLETKKYRSHRLILFSKDNFD